MKRLIQILFFSINIVMSQYDNNWAVGDSSLVSFSSMGPTLYADTTSGWAMANNSIICDSMGEISFYTDGKYVYNKYDDQILNIKYSSFYGFQNYQYSLFFNDLLNKNLVNFFFVTGPSVYVLRSTVIDIKANDDSGAVIYMPSIVYTPSSGPIFQVAPGLMAIPDANTTSWWLLAQEVSGDRFIVFNIKNGLVSIPVYYDGLVPFSFTEKGYSAVSRNGNKYLFHLVTGSKFYMCAFDFDRCAGALSNFTILDSSSINTSFGIPCFSPNDSLIYITEYSNTSFKVFQYKVYAPDFGSSKITLATINNPYNLGPVYSRIAPDGKLYIGVPKCDVPFPSPGTCPDTGYYAVVHNPNVYGPGCNFEDKFLMMPGVFYGDIPNMPLYTTPPLTAQQADCGYDTVTLTLGDSVLLGQPDTSVGKCTFSWFPSTGLNNASLAQPWCKPSTSGWYHLVVHDTTLSSPCAQTEDSVYVQVNAVGLEELLESNASAWYPNPGTGTFWLRVQLPPGATLTCSVTDLAGREVASTLSTDSEGLRLTLPDSPAGVYFVCTSLNGAVVRWDKVVVR